MDKVITLPNGRQAKIRVIPKEQIPTILPNKRGTKFEFYTNPTKDVSDTTQRIYKSNLNKLAHATGITNSRQLIVHHAKVLDYMKTLKTEAHGIFLSAIFYELNQPLFNKKDMIPYFNALHPIKLAQVDASLERTDNEENKKKLLEVKNKMIEKFHALN